MGAGPGGGTVLRSAVDLGNVAGIGWVIINIRRLRRGRSHQYREGRVMTVVVKNRTIGISLVRPLGPDVGSLGVVPLDPWS